MASGARKGLVGPKHPEVAALINVSARENMRKRRWRARARARAAPYRPVPGRCRGLGSRPRRARPAGVVVESGTAAQKARASLYQTVTMTSADLVESLYRDSEPPGPVGSWTLHIEHLGKLREADLRIHPLMLLVGENNTGKTYLTTVLYALMTKFSRLFGGASRTSPAYHDCADWVRGWIDRGTPTYTFTSSDSDRFLRLLNEILAESSLELLAHAFNHEFKQKARIEIRDFEPYKPVELVFDRDVVSDDGEHSAVSVVFANAHATFVDVDLRDAQVNHELVEFIALRHIDLGGAVTVYLPASRTGIVQLYREIIQRSHDGRRIRPRLPPTANQLTTPVLDFVELLLALDVKNEARFRDEALLLEQACLGGQVVGAPAPVVQFFYQPQGGDPLPMALSSAVVTELVPLVLTLRHELYLGFLILEEPEAHLHPKLQRVLARVIARLVRKGLRVCITTHSENLCQQINNYIKLGALPNPGASAEALGYDSTDYLESKEVVGYEFVNRGDHAVVEQLVRSPTGLQMPLFNSELLQLSNETLALQEMLDRAAGEEP